jgi:quercetin dioxygenase-like cupin family protein
MGNGVQNWDHSEWGPASLETIRLLHRPGERFRVSPGRYDPGESFPEAARAGRRYVLAGSCSFTKGGEVWELRAGEFADLPGGQFEFRVLGDSPVELVSVWELPPEFWGSGHAEPAAAPDRGSCE